MAHFSVLHRIILICPAHSSQFKERHNLGITTLKHAIYAPNVFEKLPENQIIANLLPNFPKFCGNITETKFISGITSGNSGIVNFAEINQVPLPYSMLQYLGRVATPKLVPRNCLIYLQTTLIMEGGGFVSEFM